MDASHTVLCGPSAGRASRRLWPGSLAFPLRSPDNGQPGWTHLLPHRQTIANRPQSYLTYLKGYMKAVKAELEKSNPERVPIFEKNAQAFAKKIIANFKDYEFYVGESMNPDGQVALLNYREDGTTPYL